MTDLSLHILDIAQNGIRAGATLMELLINEDEDTQLITITIIDNGSGMTPEELASATDPFYTSRTTRRVGLGLPLFKQNAEKTGGTFNICSTPGTGTIVVASFGMYHLDRPPLGDTANALMLLVSANPTLNFVYRHSSRGKDYLFDTREIKEILNGMSLTDAAVIKMLTDMIRANLEDIHQTTQR
jgi:hypothetical protein